MAKRIAVFGGSFNPPGLHHRAMAEKLVTMFDEVVVVPCGPRPDKETTNDIDPVHRAAMVDMTFRGIRNVRVDLFDLEQATFSSTFSLDVRYGSEGEVWHVVGTDLVEGGSAGNAVIQREWWNGREFWEHGRFVVFVRSGVLCSTNDMPPHHHVVEFNHPGASTKIRERIFRHENVDELVMPDVAAYIERHHLYRGRTPRISTELTIDDDLRVKLVTDERKPQLAEVGAKVLGRYLDPLDPNVIVVIGGDGTMLHAIREHWRLRAPFLGVNAGYRGFLLNDVPGDGTALEDAIDSLVHDPLSLYAAPLLYVETLGIDGEMRETLAFNDAWVQTEPGKTAWVKVTVDGVTRMERVMCDGMLVATPAGSTSYSRAMGATPVLVGTPGLVLAGSNVLEPPGWKSAFLGKDRVIEFHSADPTSIPKKRPLLGFVDGVPQGEVVSMKIRVSRIAQAELAFARDHDIAAKLTAIQFPQHAD